MPTLTKLTPTPDISKTPSRFVIRRGQEIPFVL